MRLSIKQENFCNYYIETGNASDAYRRAYNCVKSSDKTSWEKASVLLKKDKVRARVKELREDMKRNSDITKEMVRDEMRHILFADIRDYFKKENGVVVMKDMNEWTDAMGHAVEGYKMTKDGSEIKLHGKSWSSARVCKMFGYDSPQKIDITHNLLDVDDGSDE